MPAPYARVGRPGVYLTRTEEEHAGHPLDNGNIERELRHAHHRATRDDLGYVVREATGLLDQARDHRPYPGAEVRRAPDRVAGNRHDSPHQGDTLMARLVHRQRRTHVLHDHSDIHGKSARGHLPSENRVYQLLLRALRVLDLKRDDSDPGVRGYGRLHGLDGVRLVRLYAYEAPLAAKSPHNEMEAPHDIGRPLQHQPVVGRQPGLTLGAVQDDSVYGLGVRRRELDVSGKGRSAEADDAGIADDVNELPGLERVDVVPRGDRLVPRVLPVALDDYRLMLAAQRVREPAHGRHPTRDGRVDRDGDEPGRLAYHGTDLDLVPHRHHGRRRSAERLPERNDDAVGQRRLDDLVSVRELL